MTDFMGMLGTYEERKVDRLEAPEDKLIISTAKVIDTQHSFETAISSKYYNDGDWIIVEEYDTIEQAKAGHLKWMKVMLADTLPNALVDVSTSKISNICDTSRIAWRSKVVDHINSMRKEESKKIRTELRSKYGLGE